MNKLGLFTPLGYSSSRIVTAIGLGAEEFAVGQRMPCAGTGYANYAEINSLFHEAEIKFAKFVRVTKQIAAVSD